VAEAERAIILDALERHCWHRGRAARMLDISYRGLLYKIKDYGLERNAL